MSQEAFVAYVVGFVEAQYDAITHSEEPVLHPEDAARDVAVLHDFAAKTSAHPELFDNWLPLALYNCCNVPRALLVPEEGSATAMTPLTKSLLPAPTVLRAPHLAALKAQIENVHVAFLQQK